VLAVACWALAPQAGHATTNRCSGFAPVETACGTGSHIRGSGTDDVLAHDVDADFNYVGTVESVLDYTGGARIFRCTYIPGTARNCISLGAFPAKGQSFTHGCRSLVPGTVIDPADLDGVEGGYGLWQCSVTF